ncbi:tenascin-X isoform X7 [Marmota marmota marmota]|uniref:tenascin-X isoform X7 n=1 Tax=Marmota marmota marmota TaxID=9994 RepID=UPI002093A809|nr:tenascin-X isoform X7 [Marmota marmota marmota]
MPAQCPLTSSLTFLVLLGTASAGPFSPRSNVTLPAPRPPPQPGGGSPSSQLYEHTVEGGEKQVVFTHRINLPPSAGCGCPPGTEPPVPASEVQALRIRLEILEELVKGLKEQCTGGCCPAAAQAGTGQTDVRSLCSLHGVFDLSRCACSCEPGWGGPTCSDPTESGMSPSSPPAESGFCPDDCNDQGRCVRGRCVCFPGYTGPSCGWPSCPGDCQGRGRCVQGVCVCRAGFSGPDCGQRSCPRSCSQRGRCEDGRCVCDPGYAGEDCGVKSCPRGCSQRGRCENGRCVCNPGYSGEDCGVKSCPRGCSQRGRCEDGRCVCDPGYTGEDCGVRSCPWDCGEGGRCVDGRCVCWPGYAGEDCSTRTCPRNCRGRGHCEDGECICDAGYSGDDCGVRSCPGDCNQRGRCEDGRCVCWPGYTGPDCSARACPRDCRGRGRCENGVCVCNTGYSGEDCGVRSCPGDCRGRGRCESGRCVCWPGYTGRDCGTRACPGDCRGRGRCVDGRCVCNPGFTGEDCGSRRCPGDCRGHGRCEDGVCVCDAGYSGEDCSTRSCPGGCRGRGQCLDGRCVCDDGYSGEDCGVRRCPRDCSQHGVCQDGVCTCWEGYAGEDCSIRTCPSNCHGRGRCEEGRCVCDPGYTGPVCATRTCPADCRGRGRCVQGVCICHTGYGGEDCGQEEPPASACPGGCGPRELCREGQCVCVEGFRGPDCAIQICPGDCRGRGECREGSCFCQDGYAGEDCGEEVPAIENMRMHLLEETTVRTEWTRAPGSVDAYEIQFIPTTEGASPPFTARVPSSASAYDQRGLAPGQEYQVTVRALRGTSWGPPASKTITTMIDGPQDLRVVAVTPTTLELSWLRPQAEVDRFVVSYVSAGNQRVRLEVPPEADGTLLTDLMPGVEYVVTVTAERGRAVSYPASVRANTDRDGEKPRKSLGLPRLGELTVTDVTSDSLLLRWTVPEGEFDSFVIQYKDRDGPQVMPVEGPQRSAPITSLEPGRKYKFVLYGLVNKKRHGPLVAEAKILPQSDPSPETLPRLGKLWVTDPTPDSLHLSWTVPEGQFDSFIVQYKDKDGRPQVVPVEGPERSVIISPLDSDHKYRFTLFGIADKKRYGPLMADGTTAPERQEEPPHPESLEQPLLGELMVTDVTPDSLRLSWTVAQGPFDSFVVQYKDVQGQPQAVPVRGDENEVTVPGLESNRKYKMNLYGLHGRHRVGPVSIVAKTAPREVVDEIPSPTKPSMEVLETPEQPRLGELTVTDSTPDSLSLSWTVPEGQFDHFLVQYKNGDGQSKVVRVPGYEDEVTISGLEPDHKYKMHLYGFHSGQRVGPMSATGVTTAVEETPSSIEVENPSPTEPSTEAPEPTEEPLLGELMVTGTSPDSLSFSWTVPQGQFDSFTIQYKDRDGQPQVVRVGGEEREATVGDLEPGRKYKMHLYGLHQGHRVGPVSTLGVTDPFPPTQATETPDRPLEPRLGELTVTDVTPDSVGLLWTVPEGKFDAFMVQYKDRHGQPQVVPVTADQREVTIPGLEPSRKYKFLLFGIQDGKRRSPVSVEAKTAARSDASPGALPRLGELWVTDTTPESLRLSWTVPEGHFDSFVVQYKNKDGPQVVPVEGHERSATITSLDAGRKYRFLLYGLLGKKRLGPLTADATTVSPSSVDHTGIKPQLGEELQVTGVTSDSVGLSWTVPDGQFDSFVVQYKDRDGQPQVVPVDGSLREVNVSGLDPDRRYKLLLYGLHNSKRVGPLSAIAMTAPREKIEGDIPTPSPPTVEPHLGELMVEEATPHSLHLSWMVTNGEFDSFEVQYEDRDGQLQVVSTGGDQSDVTLTGLESNHRYLVTLYGFHDGQRVDSAHIEALTVPQEEENEPSEVPTMTPEPPLRPRLGELTVTDATPDSLSLSWTVPEGQFDHFLVQYKNGDGQPKVVRVPGHEDEVTISGLEPDHKYKMHLYGFHSGQRTGPVSVIGVTTAVEETPSPTEPSTEAPEPTEEPLLGELTVTGSSPDSLSLSWTVPQGHFDSFTIQYKDRDGRPQVVRVGGEEREATVGDLEPGRKYKMHLYGLQQGRRVGPVSTLGVTAPEEEPSDAPPLKPRLEELTVTDATSDTLSLSWTVPEGQFDHFLLQYKNGDGQPKAVRVPGHKDSVTISGLEPDHKYKMHLYGFHGNQRMGPVSAVGSTDPEKDEILSATLTEPPTTTPEPSIKPRLGELTVTEATPDSLSLSWTIPEGQFDHFLVQYKNGDGQPKVVRVPGHEDEVTISGLEPDHKYKMHLYGFHSGQRTGPVSVIGVTTAVEETPSPTEVEETPRPTEPSTEAPEPTEEPLLGELTVTGEASPDSLSLSWTVPQGHFDSFTIQYKGRDGRPQVVRVGGEEREATVGDLEPGRKYKMHLYGLHQGRRVGPVSTLGMTAPRKVVEETPSPTEPSMEAPEPTEEPLLGELTVTGSSPDSLSLSWIVTQGHFDSFTIQYKDRDGRPQVVHVGGEEREATVEDLEPGRKYKMHLYGLHQGHRVGPMSTVGVTEDEAMTMQVTPTTTPEPPLRPRLGELTVTDATPDSLSLSWTVPEGQFDHFLVQYKNGDGQPKVVRVPGHEDEVTISRLEPDHKYKMHLYGFHSGQRIGPVSVIGVTTPSPTEPSTEAPEPTEEPLLGELTVTGSSPDSLSLSWTVPQGQFNSFTIQYKDRDGRPQVVHVGGEEREATVGDLEPGRKYKMHLYGLHQGRRVGPVSTLGMTAAVEETPIPTEPSTEAPESTEEPLLGELTVTGSSPDSLSLSWTVPQGQFNSFTIQYKDRDGQLQVVRVGGEEREATVGDLEPGRKYKMHLYGLHQGHRVGPMSTVGVTEDEAMTMQVTPTTTPEPPLRPRLGELTVTDATPDSLSLSWTVPEGQFDHFLVQYKNGDGQPKVVRVPGHEDEVTISGLEPDHKYKMHLYGFHSGQRIGPVSVIGVTTPSPTEPSTEAPEPTEEPLLGELTVTGSSPDSLSLSWTVPQGQFNSFTIQYKDRDGRPQVVHVGGEEREATVGDLEPGRKYKMHLYGLHQGRRVGPVSTLGMTAAVEETPIPTEPSTEAPESTEEPLLGELTVTGSSPDSLSLSWTVPQGQFNSFTIQYKDRDGQLQVVRVGGEEREATVGDLEPGRKYKMHLYGLHQGHRVGPMSTVGVTEDEAMTTQVTPTTTPEPPLRPRLGELTVTDATPDSLSLSWTVPEGQFDHFLVQYKNGDGQPKVVRVPGHEDEVTISRLEPDHKYKMHLYGFHSGQRIGPVSVIGVTTAVEETPSPTEVEETPRPTEPSTEAPESTEEPLLGELTVTGSSPDSLSLSWTVPQGQFDSFTIQYKDRDGQPQVVRIGGEDREATVGDLEPGRKYKMHLYGLHQGHRVGPASAVGVTSSLPTQTPVEPHLGDLAVAAVTLDTVHLSWTVAQGPFDSFLVQYKDAQGQLQAVPVNRDLREVTVSGLDPARKYRFLLFGLLDGKRHGPVSVDVKTLPDKKPSPRLGELTVTDVTPDSMGLSWTVPEGEFDSFVIQYKDRDGQPQVVPVAADQHKVTILSLEPNRKYKFLLYGLAGRKRLGPLSADGTTAPLEKTRQPPPRLGELAVTEETSDSLRLSWTVAEGPFDSFLVQYKDTNGQSQAVPVAADQLEVTIEGLKPGRKYKFLLYGLVGGKRLGPVSVLGMTAPEEDTPAPEAPEPSEAPKLGVMAVTEATPDSLRLSWSVVQGPFDSFVVQYLDTDGQPQALLVDGDQNKVLISGLEPNTSYQFSLYGLYEGMRRGPISTEGTTGPPPAGLTPGDPGPRLSHLSVTDVTTSSLRLNWEAPLGAFDSFLLRFGVPSSSTLEPHPRPLLQRELMVPGTRRSAVLRDLRPGTLYSLTLYGLRGPHKADSIQGTARTLSPILESPRDLQFSEIGETSAMVSWVPPTSRVDSFKVSYQLADGGEPQSVQVDGRAQTQKIQGLIPGAHYEVTVVSVRGFEESEPLTGFLTTVPDGPTELRALNLTEGSTLLHWKPPQNPVDKYNVQVTAPGAPSLQDSAPGSAVDYSLRDLVLHTNYTATVRGLRGPNFTSPASITFTTGLKAPLDLETKEVTPRTALLTWTEPQVLPTGYLLSFDTPGGQTQEILLPSGITSHRLLGLFPSTYYNARLQAVWGQSLTPPVSTSFTTGGLRIPFPRDCGEEMQNGPSTSRTTTIFLNGNRERPLNVFCDMETDGGGWLVFQRRMDGQTDFWRDWEDYAHGFGNISREFWLGNEALHSLTQAGDYSMRVDLRAGDEAVFAQYDSFRVGSAAENYRLHLEGYHGTAGDSMSYHSGSVFSARDRDPNNLLISCAVSYRGAWWYRNCHYANLNGLYGSTVDHQGVSWYHWKGFEFSVPFTEMKLRPRSYRSPVGGG